MEFIGIIPARYASSRFPGKPLALLANKPMVQWVYERASLALEHVYVATDDQRIADAVHAFGGKVLLTADTHPSGTDRCAEALLKAEEATGRHFDVVINIQGDEPFIDPEQIRQLMACFGQQTQIATLIGQVQTTEQLLDPGEAKVVLGPMGDALLFSRSPIPFLRGVPQTEWLGKHTFYRHVGMYGYRRDVLLEITRLAPSPLEMAESLEQLRWLENGYRIACGLTDIEGICVDTPEDLARALASLA